MEINTEIEKTLNSLDKLQKAEMHPFLYEKIRHRMQEGKNKPVNGVVFSWKMAFAFTVILSINVLACWNYKKDVVVQDTNTSASNTSPDNYYYNTSYNY